jgi:hypothetical protein
LDADLQVIAGEVLAHSPDEAEIYKALPIDKERDVAIEYVGKVPEDLAFSSGFKRNDGLFLRL